MELRAALMVNIALTTLSAAIPVDIPYPAPASVFYQKLDHFDPDNQEHFKQRYYKHDFSSHDGAPIFLEIEGETPQGGYFTGLILETARKYEGVIMALEHRYYGESVPESFSGGIPRYLSIEQALADVANFIQAQKELYPNNPWIVFGCSYGGNLATWMRLKYPHLVQGAVAGSAPVLAKADFSEYNEVVGEVLKNKAPLCHQKILEANQELETLAETYDGQRKLARIFSIPSYSTLYGYAFHYILSEAVRKGNAFQRLKYHQTYTSEVCDLVTGNTHGKSALEIFVNYFVLQGKFRELGLRTGRDAIVGFRQLKQSGSDMWGYQTCSELGYFVTLSSKKQPFGEYPNIDTLFDAYCGPWNTTLKTLEDNIRKTNLRYGGKTPNVTNVVFMHGSNDPWHPLGVLRDLSSSARAFIFQGLSHCEFYYGRGMFFIPDERIPEWMKMLDEIETIVRSWF